MTGNLVRYGVRGLAQTATPVVAPQMSPIMPIIHTGIYREAPLLSADRLALLQGDALGVTPATNPSQLTPDQLAVVQAYQAGVNVSQSAQAAPAPITAEQQAAGSTYTTSFGQFMQTIPNSYYIGGAVVIALILMMGRKHR